MSAPSRTTTGRSWARFLVGFGVLWGVLAALAELDATGRWGVATFLAVATTAVVVEMALFRTPLRTAVSSLGLGRPGRRALVVGAVVSALVLLIYPMTAARAGRHTIWAPALIQTAIDSFKLVLIPEAAAQSFPLLLVAVSLVVPLLALVLIRGATRHPEEMTQTTTSHRRSQQLG